MDSDREALLATVAAHPDDDLPRLVYADWLEEHARTGADVARAAFIRQQIAEWRSPEPWELSGAPRPSLAAFHRHRDDWLGFLPKKQRGWVLFERGFPETLRPAKVRTAFLPLFGRPELRTVRRLVIPAGNGTRSGDYDRIAAGAHVARVRELRVEEYATGAQFAALLSGPRLGGLETLQGTGSTHEAWRVLAAPAPPGVRRLRLDSAGYMMAGVRNTITEVDVEQSSLLRGLAELELYAWDSDAALRAVCAGAGPRDLTRFALLVIDRGVLGSLDRPVLRRLTVHMPDGAAENAEPVADELARNPRLTGLEALALGRPVGLTSFTRLVESPALAGLKRLDVEVAGDQAALTDYLLADAGPLRFDKLCVGRAHFTASRAARLRAKYGAKLQLHADRELEPTLRRLGRW